MGAFHQIGHHSANLMDEAALSTFAGAILSPVNYSEAATEAQVARHQGPNFECVLDPQLYVPNSSRGQLPSWSHFPSDVDTADLTSLPWWFDINQRLVAANQTIGSRTICSPAMVPRSYSPDYYDLTVQVAEDLRARAPVGTNVLLTLVVDIDRITEGSRVHEISSIATRAPADGIYLLFQSSLLPRREYRDGNMLGSAGQLVRLISATGARVLVGYCCSDLVLWKHAGATDCATGKFWNLRRFSPERWEEAGDGGGGPLAYWTEGSLLAFLREGDLDRLSAAGLIPQGSLAPVAAQAVLMHRQSNPGDPWVAASWRQYLEWFGNYEAAPHTGHGTLDDFLSAVETAWDTVDANNILMEERANDGSWIRHWRIAARAI